MGSWLCSMETGVTKGDLHFSTDWSGLWFNLLRFLGLIFIIINLVFWNTKA